MPEPVRFSANKCSLMARPVRFVAGRITMPRYPFNFSRGNGDKTALEDLASLPNWPNLKNSGRCSLTA
jgi:hypothetical protein